MTYRVIVVPAAAREAEEAYLWIRNHTEEDDSLLEDLR